jgi:hypothetical protein
LLIVSLVLSVSLIFFIGEEHICFFYYGCIYICNETDVNIKFYINIMGTLIRIYFCFFVFLFGGRMYAISSMAIENILLKTENFQIVLSDNESSPVRLAAKTLCRDFERVMGWHPDLVESPNPNKVNLIIMTDENQCKFIDNAYPLDGFESHRIDVDSSQKCIYLLGKDMRGAIYAIYTFSEEFLGVPPLWYFSSWIPEHKDVISISNSYSYYQRSPQVRYRAWFPNDTDLFTPWRRLSVENNELWLETMLRLKLNTVELEATVTYPNYRLNSQAELLRKYGLVLTSHHHVALNNNFLNWDGYWKEVRHTTPPRLLLSNEKELIEFWRYSVETVNRSGMENLWQISFRGKNDQPFWAAFEDAPKTDKERAEVINKMIRIQLDLIKEITGERNPYVRMTFYDELSDLLAAGYLEPPMGKNMLWTFVAARRDHYPNTDLVEFDNVRDVKLGYYFNLQFTSTGAHLAPAEGPWKMEANYRYVNSKAPLDFSVVNAGNIREFVLSLSANARMMWNLDLYDTNNFLLDYCTMYFGEEYAEEIAELYHDYFYSYWEQKSSEFPGLERQYLFQDLRYSRVYEQIAEWFKKGVYTSNPLHDIGFERMPGRSFRIEGNSQVDSLLVGMRKTAPRFRDVAEHCRIMLGKLPENKQVFFRDNLYAPCLYMAELSFSMENYVLAYKSLGDVVRCREYLKRAISHLEKARDALYVTQEGVFVSWYKGDSISGKFNLPQKIECLINLYDSIR